MNETILIIGNGPSTKALADFGFHNLPDSIDTFAMGAAYRYFERINWWPDYYAWCDVKVAHSHRESFRRLIEDPKVTTRRFFFPLPVTNASRLEIVPHSSTGDFCFEKAVSLGYKTIYMIGIEGNYIEAIDGSRPMTDAEFDARNMQDVFDIYASIYKSREQARSNFRNNLRIIDKEITDNPNYFFPDYQRKGDVFSAPRSHTHRNNWKKRVERCATEHVRVYNLSASSMIDAFPKQDFSGFIRGYANRTKAARDNPGRAISRAQRPLVSLIIPVYNVRDYIASCLNSVKNQIYDDIEVIVINDGCTDDTMDLVHQCVQGWNKVKIIDQKNLGLGGARNTGLDHSTGEYIIFVDSDDEITPDHVSRFMDLIAENPHIDIVTSQCSFIDDKGVAIPGEKNVFRPYDTRQGKRLSAAEQLLGLYASSVAWARLYRASLIRGADFRFPNHLPHEDWFFTYKAFYRAKMSKSIKNKTYRYRVRANSLSKNISINYVQTMEMLISDTFDYLNKKAQSDLLWELLARRIAIAIHSLVPRIKESEQKTREAFSKLFEKHYALIISSVRRLANGPLGHHWTPKGIIEFIESLINDQKNKLASYKTVALRAPDFYFKSPEQRIPALKDRFKGARCFIIGNGPTLNNHDMELLRGEVTFAVNSFFYKSDETGFMPTFYVVEDSKVAEERAEEINAYPYPYKLVPKHYRNTFINDAYNISYVNVDMGFYKTGGPFYGVPRFSEDAANSVIAGQTVTYLNMQLAYYMGFAEVYLIGMDFHYIIPAEHKISGNHILSTTDDPNHFHKDYFGVGKTWKDPKLDRVAINYRHARQAFERAGRKIYNATIGGKLEIFDRVDYESLLRDPTTGRKRTQSVQPVIVSTGDPMDVPAPVPSTQATPWASTGTMARGQLEMIVQGGMIADPTRSVSIATILSSHLLLNPATTLALITKGGALHKEAEAIVANGGPAAEHFIRVRDWAQRRRQSP